MIVLYGFMSQLNKYSFTVKLNDSHEILNKKYQVKTTGTFIKNDFNPICQIPDIKLTGHTNSEPGDLFNLFLFFFLSYLVSL